MTQPNRIQWLIIWVAVLIAVHIWFSLSLASFAGDPWGRWGLHGYLSPMLYTYNRSKAAFTVLAVGGLLAWQAAGLRGR